MDGIGAPQIFPFTTAVRHEAGFSAAEISSLLDVGSNYVNVARHRKKTTAKKRAGAPSVPAIL